MESEVAGDRVFINSAGFPRWVLPIACTADPLDADSVTWEEITLHLSLFY